MALLGKKQLAFKANAYFSGQKNFFPEMVTEKSNFVEVSLTGDRLGG